MLKRTLDYGKPLRAVTYSRMSSELQNQRSPDQQLDEITSRIQRRGLPWRILKDYRDDAISGRYLGKRRSYQQMMREIKSRVVSTDLILVDTAERLGRVDELSTIRSQLRDKFGVLVLTADSNFADPSSPEGKALGMVEQMRATEHSRILAHNVVRGKRDAARQGHWPGGAPPLGFKLETVMRHDRHRTEVDHSILVPDPVNAAFVGKLFAKAAQTGWAGSRLAKHFNESSDCPSALKPLSPSTVTYILANPIYFGLFEWNAHSTGIVADVRVVEPNNDDEILRIPDYCEALVSREIWDVVNAMAQQRRHRSPSTKEDGAVSDKLIKIRAPGVSIKYPLSGLVFCSECGCRMRATSTGVYKAKDGNPRRYTNYSCPGFASGRCLNATKVREEWLRHTVIRLLLNRLTLGFDMVT